MKKVTFGNIEALRKLFKNALKQKQITAHSLKRLLPMKFGMRIITFFYQNGKKMYIEEALEIAKLLEVDISSYINDVDEEFDARPWSSWREKDAREIMSRECVHYEDLR